MQCKNYDCTTDTRYGMHEDFEYYQKCKMRQRNKGLFIADQVSKNHLISVLRVQGINYSDILEAQGDLLVSVIEWPLYIAFCTTTMYVG